MSSDEKYKAKRERIDALKKAVQANVEAISALVAEADTREVVGDVTYWRLREVQRHVLDAREALQ